LTGRGICLTLSGLLDQFWKQLQAISNPFILADFADVPNQIKKEKKHLK
jgi:hypothetical protein